ncbi:MAG: nucleotidyltransferase family protein [Chloroflexi bacterium]|nr:nucleotidyltransferase family protein [Chloroflexota bacterium]
MDQTNHSGLDQTYRLLALCARAESHPSMVEQLSRQVEAFTSWQELPIQAELHGMAPLLWHHIRKSGISIPLKTRQTLEGLYLRHRIFNQAHTLILLEVSSLFEQAGIRALVLKGLALAHQYYPDPALRPVSDIDLLLKQADVLPALDLLAGAGFRVDSPRASRTLNLLSKELTADSPLRDGISTHVELHHYDPRQRTLNDNIPDNEFIGFDAPPHTLTIGERVVYTPAPMDTLNYLCRHLQRHLFEGTANKPLQLKWVADIVSFIEHHAETMDWDYLRRRDKAFLERLEVFYSLTPLPERYAKIIPVRNIAPPSGLNQYPKGWPQQRVQKWRQVGVLQFLELTFSPPSRWWLRLYYGINERSCFWYGQIFHRIRIFRLMLWALIRKIPWIASK